MSQSPRVEVKPATLEQKPILDNLLELYCHDFSEFFPVELAADGRFHYPHLESYWSEPGRLPFLVTVDDRLAGFVLVKHEERWDMAEFFIARGFRRSGAGMAAARAVWKMLPGAWEVRVMRENIAGHRFWQRAISAYLDHPIESQERAYHGRSWDVFSFEAKPVEYHKEAPARS